MKVGVIGAGSLGTALAQTIAQNVDEVLLHLRRQSLADDINSTAKELAEVSKQFNMQLTGSLDKTFECFDNNLGDIARHLSGTISEIEATTDRVPNIVLAAYDGMEKTLKELNENMKEAVASLEKMRK